MLPAFGLPSGSIPGMVPTKDLTIASKEPGCLFSQADLTANQRSFIPGAPGPDVFRAQNDAPEPRSTITFVACRES